MYKKIFLPFVLTFISFLFILISYNEPNVVENKTNAVVQNENLSLEKSNDSYKPKGKIIGYKEVEVNGKMKKIPIYYDPADTNGIEPKALPCDYYSIYVSEFDHYAPKSGKTLGIFNMKENIKSATELHNKWGFNGYLDISQTKIELINIGYDYNNIMVEVTINNGQYSLPSDIYYKYYVNEPFEKSTISVTNMINLANAVYSINANATVNMGSYKDTDYYLDKYTDVLSSTSNSRMMCDQYYDGTIFYGHDQRAYWDWFKNNYGPKVYTHFIHILIDGIQGDFNMLFDKANSLGLNTLWLYAGDAENCNWYELGGICETLNQSNYKTYLNQFCNTAFNKGWLRCFVKTYKYMYHCPDYYNNPCYCSQNDTGWELAWIQYMETYEIFP